MPHPGAPAPAPVRLAGKQADRGALTRGKHVDRKDLGAGGNGAVELVGQGAAGGHDVHPMVGCRLDPHRRQSDLNGAISGRLLSELAVRGRSRAASAAAEAWQRVHRRNADAGGSWHKAHRAGRVHGRGCGWPGPVTQSGVSIVLSEMVMRTPIGLSRGLP